MRRLERWERDVFTLTPQRGIWPMKFSVFSLALCPYWTSLHMGQLSTCKVWQRKLGWSSRITYMISHRIKANNSALQLWSVCNWSKGIPLCDHFKVWPVVSLVDEVKSQREVLSSLVSEVPLTPSLQGFLVYVYGRTASVVGRAQEPILLVWMFIGGAFLITTLESCFFLASAPRV